MTKLPLDSWEVQGLEGAGYVANAVCAAPGCGNVVGERHHLWRRSFLMGDYWWVVLPNGSVSGNVVFLCPRHHQAVTENKAQIVLSDGVFWWRDSLVQMDLQWQPPHYLDRDAWLVNEPAVRDSKPPGKKRPQPVFDTTVCPGCGQPWPKPKEKREKPVVRKTWSLSVPVAEQENGAQLLDDHIAKIRHLFLEAGLAYGSEETAKYYILATAISLFITHSEYILDEGSTA